MASNWYCRIAGRDHGPYGLEELAALARDGRLSPLDFIREGDGGVWFPAAQVGWLAFPPPPSPPVNSPQVGSTAGSTAVWPWVLVGMAALAALCVGVLGILVVARSAGNAGVPQLARLRVSGHDATSELQSFVENLSDEQRVLLGIAVLATASDIYAAEITITNTGSVPVQVFPQNISIHYGGEVATITTSDHARFLHVCFLQPGEYTQGLVMYEARIDIGTAMRLGGGAVAYNDPTIEVEYAQ